MNSIEHLTAVLRGWGEAQPHVDAVWVFGSIAKGKTHPGSDTDITVLFAHGKQPKGMEKLDLIAELSDCVHTDVDVVILNTAGELITSQVLRFGSRVFSKNPTRTALFELAAYGKYSDYAYYKNTFVAARKQQVDDRS